MYLFLLGDHQLRGSCSEQKVLIHFSYSDTSWFQPPKAVVVTGADAPGLQGKTVHTEWHTVRRAPSHERGRLCRAWGSIVTHKATNAPVWLSHGAEGPPGQSPPSRFKPGFLINSWSLNNKVKHKTQTGRHNCKRLYFLFQIKKRKYIGHAQGFLTNPTLGCGTRRNPSQGGIGDVPPSLCVTWRGAGALQRRIGRIRKPRAGEHADGHVDGTCSVCLDMAFR